MKDNKTLSGFGRIERVKFTPTEKNTELKHVHSGDTAMKFTHVYVNVKGRINKEIKR
jgi:hypothetical protein